MIKNETMISKKELEIGDIIITNDGSTSQYAIVDKLKVAVNNNPNKEVENQYVGVKLIKTEELKSVHLKYLSPIKVDYSHLVDLDVEHMSKDEMPVYKIGTLIMSVAVIHYGNNKFYSTGLSLVNDWKNWLESDKLFKSKSGNKDHIKQFPFLGELHLLIRELKRQKISFEIEKLLHPLT